MPIKNVLMYVCDALRWDKLPPEINERGITFKTVAQSLWSPPCFTTLSTGKYPENHGVLKWNHKLANGVRTIYDIDGLDGAYYNKNPNDRLADVFDVSQHRTLDELHQPFFYLERDLTTHAPYNQREPSGSGSYLKEVGDNWDQINADYQKGIKMSQEIFEERIDLLEELGIRDDTLVIFTADHGELLGEYGDISHSNPACPEIVYVPTVFIHPSLSAEDFFNNYKNEIIEQVDVVKTALSMIGWDAITTDGVDLRSTSKPNQIGYNYMQVKEKGIPFYEARSAWDYNGGHVYLENSKIARIVYFIYRQARSTHRHSIRNDWISVLQNYIHNTYRFGEPGFSATDAREFIDTKVDSFDGVDPAEITLSEETKKQLQDMGYRM